VDVYLQAKQNAAAAKRFLKPLLRRHGGEPRKIVTAKLLNYAAAHRELAPETIHCAAEIYLKLGRAISRVDEVS